jgi:hypothetical protein
MLIVDGPQLLLTIQRLLLGNHYMGHLTGRLHWRLMIAERCPSLLNLCAGSRAHRHVGTAVEEGLLDALSLIQGPKLLLFWS